MNKKLEKIKRYKLFKKLNKNLTAANIDDVVSGDNNGTLKADQVRQVRLDSILEQNY